MHFGAFFNDRSLSEKFNFLLKFCIDLEYAECSPPSQTPVLIM